jgi:hypothetical protein
VYSRIVDGIALDIVYHLAVFGAQMGPNRNYEANAPKTRLLAKAAEDRGPLSGQLAGLSARIWSCESCDSSQQVLPTHEARLVRSPIGARVKAASPFPFEGGSALSDSLSRRHARREAADKSRDTPIHGDCESETPKSGLQNVNGQRWQSLFRIAVFILLSKHLFVEFQLEDKAIDSLVVLPCIDDADKRSRSDLSFRSKRCLRTTASNLQEK